MRPETLVLAGVLVLLVLVLRRPRRRRHSLLYRWYMRSGIWRARRVVWYWSAGRRCEKCGCKVALHRRGVRYGLGAPVATIHHKHYRTLGRERRRDVVVCCWRCHSRQDAWRYAG